MIVTDTGATQFVGNKKYITYKAAGVDGVDSRSWSFDWIAPDSTISEVGFYGAFNSNPGHKDNDKTFLSVLKVYRAGHKSSINSVNKTSACSVFPNPSNSKIAVKFEQVIESNTSIEILDLNGRTIKSLLNTTIPQGHFSAQFDISDVASGTYILSIINANGRINQSILITGN
jgi:hypothetical protein